MKLEFTPEDVRSLAWVFNPPAQEPNPPPDLTNLGQLRHTRDLLDGRTTNADPFLYCPLGESSENAPQATGRTAERALMALCAKLAAALEVSRSKEAK